MAHALTDAGFDAFPRVRKIDTPDLKAALERGLDDFLAMPSHAIFLSVIYPIVGLIVVQAALGGALMPLIFPLVAGFALVGPFAAIGLYELSRRREQGLDCTASHVVVDLFQSPAIGSVAVLGLSLMVVFLVWLAVAQGIYFALFGGAAPESLAGFVHDLAVTPAGHLLIIVGNGVGFLFALLVLTISVVSFPLLLDRQVGLGTAVLTSCRAVAANPATMALWGLIVAAALVLGSAPLLFGLAVVFPVLGHATWHLYRAIVVAD
jgi:uncharacterized membrane protein